MKTAVYVPPNLEDMQIAMSDLEKYINNEDNIDPLIKIALIHYQFETIHPRQRFESLNILRGIRLLISKRPVMS